MRRLLAVLLVFAGLLSGCQDKTQADIQRDLGFRHGSPYYIINGTGTEVLDVSFVQPGGVFVRAGFKTGDIFSTFAAATASMSFMHSWKNLAA
jgi:hypothetical protein